MRAGLSVLALLGALLVVWLLSGRQLQSMQSTQGSASGPGAADPAAQQAQKVQQAIERGAAARASEAAAQ